MKGYKPYTITCLHCGGSRKIEIHSTEVGDRINWLEDKQNEPAKIISGRKRLDDHWGWQCTCQNSSLMTKQEQRNISNPASPTPQEITDIVQNLKLAKVKVGHGKVQVDGFEMAEL